MKNREKRRKLNIYVKIKIKSKKIDEDFSENNTNCYIVECARKKSGKNLLGNKLRFFQSVNKTILRLYEAMPK